MGEIPGNDKSNHEVQSRDARNMAMLAHLLGLLGPMGFIGPLIVWSLKKDEHAFVEEQAREALNFQLTMLIGWIAATTAGFLPCFGFLFYPALFVVNIIFCILAAMKVSEGKPYRYPVAIRFIKG